MNRLHDAIDIVIPVYNGYDDIRMCMDSIRRHTDLTKHYVIIVNDCSPDERIAPYLNSQAEEHIHIIHNETNLGFSANVNKGMLFSKRDSLLLNSDTIVTAGWIDKIQRCAYADESIATVTPLSNAATLCSVPVMCQDNSIPDGFTVDEYAELIERCSLKRYPEITVAVGFCMYIKQNVIDEVGFFDAATFERGYGEENDFCNRCEQMGYRHVMCDDTLVYHKGTGSFNTEEKMALSKAHEAILNEWYPEQMMKNHLYCMNNPDQEIRDNVNMYAKLHNHKKNLMFVAHLDFQAGAQNNVGGIQMHVKELVTNLREVYNVFMVARDKEYLLVTCYTDDDVIKLKFHIGETALYSRFRDKKIEKIFHEIIRAFQIDLVHVHHTQNISLEPFYVAKEYDLPLYMTIHDHYTLCPTIVMLNRENQYCLFEKEKDCESCLRDKCGYSDRVNGYIEKWRKEYRKVLNLCDVIFYPSESIKNTALTFYPELADKSQVIYHGTDKIAVPPVQIEKPQNVKKSGSIRYHFDNLLGDNRGFNIVRGWAFIEGHDSSENDVLIGLKDKNGKEVFYQTVKGNRADVAAAYGDETLIWSGFRLISIYPDLAEGPCELCVYIKEGMQCYTDGRVIRFNYSGKLDKQKRINVGFLGGMVPAKGSQLAKEMISKEKEKVNWLIFGEVGDKELSDTKQENLYFSGPYLKENIIQMLQDNEVDIICILPSCAETFCYTLSESWLAGIPVLGTDIGAVGERIRLTGAGWTVPWDSSAEQVLDKLYELIAHPEEIQRVKNIVKNMEIKDVHTMTEEYKQYYINALAKKSGKTAVDWDREFIFQALALANEEIAGKGYYGQLNRLQRENNLLKNTLEMTKGTLSYRLARKIANIKIPFKEQIKKRLKR